MFISWARRSSAKLWRPVIQPVRRPAMWAKGEALTVMRVKGLNFERNLFGLGEQSDAAICHCAVHVHEEQFDVRSALLESSRDFGKFGHGASTVGFWELEDQSCSDLNLPRTADGGEYPAGIIGKVAGTVLKYDIPVSSLGQRTLCIAWDSEIGMIQKVESFCAKGNFLAFAKLKALPEGQVDLRVGRTTQQISSRVAKLVGRRQCKRAGIEPAACGAYSGAVRAGTDVGITNQVGPLRQYKRLSISIIKGQHWGERHVTVKASDTGNLPTF